MGGFEHIFYFIIAVGLVVAVSLVFLFVADRMSHVSSNLMQEVLGGLAVFAMLGVMWLVMYLFWFSLFSGVLLLSILGFFYVLARNTLKDLRAGS